MSTYPAYVKQVLATDVNLLRKIIADLIPILEGCSSLSRSNELEESYQDILKVINNLNNIKSNLS